MATFAPQPRQPTESETCKLGYSPVLNGIQGLTELPVLGHNLKINWLRGGFFGVDFF